MSVLLDVLPTRDMWFDELTNRGSTSSPTMVRYSSAGSLTIEKMKGYTYILECSNGQYYVGSTDNLDKVVSASTRLWGQKIRQLNLESSAVVLLF